MRNFNIQVSGMHCQSCVGKIKTAFDNMDQVEKADVDLASGRVDVSGDDSLSMMAVKSTIESLGFGVDKISKG